MTYVLEVTTESFLSFLENQSDIFLTAKSIKEKMTIKMNRLTNGAVDSFCTLFKLFLWLQGFFILDNEIKMICN